MDTHTDIVVVGAGLAGLTAAATASRGGATTLVLEAHRPGGRARVTERDGFTWNLGTTPSTATARARPCSPASGSSRPAVHRRSTATRAHSMEHSTDSPPGPARC